MAQLLGGESLAPCHTREWVRRRRYDDEFVLPQGNHVHVGGMAWALNQSEIGGELLHRADDIVGIADAHLKMLAPFLAILSTVLARTAAPGHVREPGGTRQSSRTVIPWFALGFVGVAACNSLDVLPKIAVATAITFDTIILAMAMAALGLTTHVSAIRSAGIKPLALAASLFAWLIFGGGAINAAITAFLG
jgi:uncharacterized integral membrane protein (TIGR00698 family)